MREDRTLVISNARSSAPSFVAFDDGALNELEAAAHLVGASASGSPHVPRSSPARMPSTRATTPRTAAAETPNVTARWIAALVAGGFVALVTAATLVFYFVVP